jgi:hypothetical protein
MRFGTIIVTKDRNHCLDRTLKALLGTELTHFPIVLLNNGSEVDDPGEIIKSNPIECEYINVGFNPGIVGSRILAHRVAQSRAWTHYCFLQDDFELKASKPWLRDTLLFIETYKIDYCRLTVRESTLSDSEHWVKAHLREWCGAARWNCSHIQLPKPEQVGDTTFIITDKHYSDWVHIMSHSTSMLLFGKDQLSFDGLTVTERLMKGDHFSAFQGAIRSEFDIAVKQWIAYSLGLTSATGIIMERPTWSGLFDHFTSHSAGDRRELPKDPLTLARLAEGWRPG